MTAEEILKIPLAMPFLLFRKDKDERHDQFKGLAKTWHPDICGRGDVFSHINALYQEAEKPAHIVRIRTKSGKQYDLNYIAKHTFELGTMLIGQNIISFITDKKHDDLLLNGLRSIGSVRYPDDKMKNQHAKFIPHVERSAECEDGSMLTIIHKDQDALLLRDILTGIGKIEPKHVCWIVSSLLNLTCFYEISGFCHNGLSVDTVFISPPCHTAFPVGGWWYASPVGKTIKYLPPSSHAIAPRDMIRSKTADHRLDLESIRLIARTCLGDASGGSLTTAIPKPFAQFLRLPAPKSPVKDYENWSKVLKDSYGPRRYLELSLTAQDVYR